MKHSEFEIGKTFWCGGSPWRCTDIGTRTIIAIRLDEFELGTQTLGSSEYTRFTLSYDEANARGWFKGTPYAVVESTFDEYDINGCSLSQEPG